MWNDRRLCDLFEIDHPIIQAPMAGATTPAMAAAASNAGALGSLGCATFSVDQLQDEIQTLKEMTSRDLNIKPFNINFFVHKPPQPPFVINSDLKKKLDVWYNRLNAGTPPEPSKSIIPFDAKICECVCDLSPKVVSFHFGLPDQELVRKLKTSGLIILSTATSVKEALWLEKNGADAIIAQGFEAGGHSGWFLERGQANLTGTMALIPRVVDAVSLPVIAAGGIADGRGIAAALMLGASGVQIGTAFLNTAESGTSTVHKAALLKASGDDTMLSKAFSGRSARTIVNDYASDLASLSELPQFPVMNSISGPLRQASIDEGIADAVSLWSGQAVGLNREIETAELIRTLVDETTQLLHLKHSAH